MRRTSRIQTIITPLHRKKLDQLIETFGSMNEVIERGIELLEAQESLEGVPITSDEVEKMRWNSEVFNSLSSFSGFGLLKTLIIDEFLEVLTQKISFIAFLKKQKQWILEDIEIQRIINQLVKQLENTPKNLMEVIIQVSDTFRTFKYAHNDLNDDKIAIYPNYFQKIPEIIAFQLQGILDYLGFTYTWYCPDDRVIIQWTDDPIKIRNSIQNIEQKIYQKREKFLQELGIKDTSNVKQIPTELTTIIKTLELTNWQNGVFITGNRRFTYFPQDLLLELIDTINTNQKNDKILNRIGELFSQIRTSDLEPIKHINDTTTLISHLAYNLSYIMTNILGWGKVDILDEKKIKISNTLLPNKYLKPILDGYLSSYGFNTVEATENEFFNYFEYEITNTKIKILIIDDDSFWLTTLSKFVEKINNNDTEIYTSDKPQKALDILKTKPIEVIVCDYGLPEMNGVDFLEKINKLYPNIIKIIITGQEDKKIVVNGLNKAKIDYFIQKPPEPSELQQIIYEQVMERRSH